MSLSAPDMPSGDVDVGVSAPDMPSGDVDASVSVPDVPSADVKVPKKGLLGKFLKKKSSKDGIDVSGAHLLGLLSLHVTKRRGEIIYKSTTIYRIADLLSGIKYGNRRIFHCVTFSAVDQFFHEKIKTPVFFPDEVHMGRGGVGVFGLGYKCLR